MKNILFVEDEPHFSRVMGFLLNRAGFMVTHCANGEDALKAIEEHDFECVITDYRMSHVSGLNVAQISRKKWPNIPIFLLTAIPPDLLDQDCKGVVNEIFVKPVNCDEFIDRIRKSLAEIQKGVNRFEGDTLSENQPNI